MEKMENHAGMVEWLRQEIAEAKHTFKTLKKNGTETEAGKAALKALGESLDNIDKLEQILREKAK